MRSFYTKNKQYIFLFLIAIVAYWQIGFLFNSLKWDMIDGFLPLRYFTAECIKNGTLPLWNPYQQCGYPIYANLICTWNPEVIITGWLFGYNNITLHIFFILYIFLAGTGIYNLMIYLTKDKKVSFIIGVSYMLSGFFLAHTSHADYISGGAWIPFVILNYFKLLNKINLKNILNTILFLFLILTTGYPAISIILAYLLLYLFLEKIIRLVITKEYKSAYRITLSNILILTSLILLCFGIFISWQQVSPFVSRFNSVSIESALAHPFSPQSLLSILFPFSTVGETDFFKTDISMNNIYMGLFFPILFVISLINKKDRSQWIFLSFGFICLLFAMGDYLPFREIAFKYLPLMNKFKYPAVFRIFTIFSFLIFSGIGISKSKESIKNNGYIYTISYGFLITIALFVLYSLFNIVFKNIEFLNFKDTIENTIKDSSIYSRIVIQGLIQIFLLLLFIRLLKRKKFLKHLTLLLVIELIIAIQLNIYRTGVSPFSAIKTAKYINKQVQGFPIPSDHNVIKNKSNACQYLPMWKNTNVFSKRISWETYNPLIFNSYYKLTDEYPYLLNKVIDNPLLYFSNKVYTESKLEIRKDSICSNDIFISDSIYANIQVDTSVNNNINNIEITYFDPNKIETKVISSGSQVLTFLQSNYTGWKVFIDDIESNIFTSNFLFMSTLIPQGEHTVRFEYINKPIKTAFYIEFIGFLILCSLLYFLYLKKSSNKKIVIPLSIIVLSMILLYSMFFNKPYQKIQEKEYKNITNILNNATNSDILINVDNDFLLKNNLTNKNVISKRIRYEEDIFEIIKLVESSTKEQFIYVWSNTTKKPEISQIIQEKYPKLEFEYQSEHSQVFIYKKDSNYIPMHLFQSINTFDSPLKYWNFNTLKTDTLFSNTYYKITPDIQFSPVFNTTFNTLDTKLNNAIINLNLKFKCNNDIESFLVLQIDGKKNKKIYKAMPLNSFINNDKKWSKAYLSYKLPQHFNSKRILKAYVWNPKGDTIFIDDFCISIDKNN